MAREFFQKTGFLIGILVFFALKVGIALSTGLGDDEAYYWDWTRELSWSYFDHPPMTAWLIAASQSFLGHSELAVRMPALISTFFCLVFLFLITRRIYNTQAACWSVLLFFLIPLYSLGSTLMVPDVPLMFFWLFIVWILSRHLDQQKLSTFEWTIIGFLAAAGFLTKIPMILLPGSVFLMMLFHREWRTNLAQKGPWLAFALMLLGLIPLLIWNFENDWVTFQFHFSDRHRSQGISWDRWGQFVAVQMAFTTPIVFFIFWLSPLIWMIKKVPHRAFQFWMSFPTLILFSIQPLFSDFKPHWTAPGYLMLLPFLGFWIQDRPQTHWGRRFKMVLVSLSLAFILPINILFFSNTQYPFVETVVTRFFPDVEWQPKWNPINDLFGWPQVADEIYKIQSEEAQPIAQTPEPIAKEEVSPSKALEPNDEDISKESLVGDLETPQPENMPAESAKEIAPKDPDPKEYFLAAGRYQLTAPLSFYTRQKAWSLSSKTDQYDFFKNRPDLRGKNAIFVADNRFPQKPQNFEKCDPPKVLPIYRRSFLAREFYIYKCTNYLGE